MRFSVAILSLLPATLWLRFLSHSPLPPPHRSGCKREVTPNTRQDHIHLNGELHQARKTTAGEGKSWRNHLIAPPVVSLHSVVAMDAGAHISAHDIQDITTRLWTYTLNRGDDDTTLVGGGLAHDGDTVYTTFANGYIVALDAKNGQVIWERRLKSPVRSMPAIARGILLVVTVDSQLFALDAGTGGIVWQHRGIRETSSLLGIVVPATDRDRVIVAYPSGEIYALALRDGQVLWTDSLILPQRTVATGSFTGVGGDPVIADHMVFTVGLNGLLAANDITSGLRIWEQPVSSASTPWVSGDFLYILSTDRQLICLYRRDGRIKWVTPLPESDDDTPQILQGPYLMDGLLHVIASDGTDYRFSPVDGTLHDRKTSFPGAISAPAFARGKMYYTDQDAALYSLP